MSENVVKLTSKEIKEHVSTYQDKLDNLRKDGSFKIRSLEENLIDLKSNKEISKEEKIKEKAKIKDETLKAKEVKKGYKEEEASIIKEGKAYLKENFEPLYKEEKAEAKVKKAELKVAYKAKVEAENKEYKEKVDTLNQENPDKKDPEYKAKLEGLRRTHSSRLYELKLNYKKEVSDVKNELHDLYLDKVNCLQNLNDDKLTVNEKLAAWWEKYCFRFNFKDYLLRNGLYIVMIIVFLLCGIISPLIDKGTLLNANNIFEILKQSSPRIFLALGVGGLILLAGTDLSIGRMVGLGTCITCMFLYPGTNIMPLFGHNFDFTSWPAGLRILCALLVTVILTTLFSSIAGFFTAKFKMHPFISTMGTQLIIFGLLAIVTEQNNTGVIDMSIKKMVDTKILGNTIPTLLIYAIIGILIVSFIWNKTKFGKNMYAVGGNPEAASVSGISVFWVTMGVFIMAGILYGFGSFFEGVRVGTAKFDTGTGYETDAIAACVVGGISFTGGVGKIKGAVIGAIIFTALTYALTFLGLNPYYQYVIKGIIIIAAVSLDCLKYLKKK